MDRNRILELAVETLEKRKAGINAEIETIRAELKEIGSGTTRKVKPAAASTRRRRLQTRAERKAHSERMKQYWAAKRARAAKAKKPTLPNLKLKRATANKAISEGMRAYWAKRKAETGGEIVKTKPKADKAPKQPPKA